MFEDPGDSSFGSDTENFRNQIQTGGKLNIRHSLRIFYSNTFLAVDTCQIEKPALEFIGYYAKKSNIIHTNRSIILVF